MKSRYQFPVIVLVIIVCGLLTGGLHGIAAQPVEGNTCTTNVDLLNGQSRFSLTGLSRFSLTGLEGANATLDSSELDPELQALYQEVKAHIIDARWMQQFTQPVIAGNLELPGAPDKTAILVVDDFPDRSISTDSLRGDWLAQINDYYGPGYSLPENISVQTHGDIVTRVIEDLLEELNNTGSDSLQQLYNNIAVFPVDISIGGTYELSVLNTRLQQVIGQARDAGYERFVVNMSIGLLPCEVPATTRFPAFNYQQFLAARAEASVADNYRFDVDAQERNPGRQTEVFTPVVYNGYGLIDYIIETYFPDGEPQEQEDMALEYLRSIIEFTALRQDTDPEIEQLGTQLQGYLNLSSENGPFALIPIAASGNYADILPDAPLAPASLPQVIAVGAQLGMQPDSEEWIYSQPSHLIAPGAWYNLYDSDSYVAGTSFAAPYASVISSMFVAFRETCDFSDGRPPLKDFAFVETVLALGSNPFDCSFDGSHNATPTPPPTSTPLITPTPQGTLQPTNTPDGTTTATAAPTTTVGNDLIVNGGFEAKDDTGKPSLAPWFNKGLLKDKIKCDKDTDDDGILDKFFAYEGGCAFVFKGSVGEKSKIGQTFDAANLNPAVGNTLTLNLFVKGDGAAVSGKVKLRVKYSDGTPTGKITLNFLPTSDYIELTDDVMLDSANVQAIKLQVQHTSPSGKVSVDAVKLLYAVPALLPLP